MCFWTEMLIVNGFSMQNAHDSPTIAIITSLFTEKIAVDSMIDKKVSYIRYSTDGNVTAPILLDVDVNVIDNFSISLFSRALDMSCVLRWRYCKMAGLLLLLFDFSLPEFNENRRKEQIAQCRRF